MEERDIPCMEERSIANASENLETQDIPHLLPYLWYLFNVGRFLFILSVYPFLLFVFT